MAEGFCGKLSKFYLFLLNFLVFALSIAIIVFGVLSLTDKASLQNLVGSSLYASGAYVVIIVGAIALFISFLGCCGAYSENKCMLVTYFIIMLLIVVLMFTGAILGFVYRGKLESVMKDTMATTLKTQYGIDIRNSVSSPEREANKAITDSWNAAQKEFTCCAIDDTAALSLTVYKDSDWCTETSPNKTANNKERPPSPNPCVPESCCGQVDGKYCGSDKIYREGCYQKLYNYFEKNVMLYAGIAIGVALLLLFSVIAPICLWRNADYR